MGQVLHPQRRRQEGDVQRACPQPQKGQHGNAQHPGFCVAEDRGGRAGRRSGRGQVRGRGDGPGADQHRPQRRQLDQGHHQGQGPTAGHVRHQRAPGAAGQEGHEGRLRPRPAQGRVEGPLQPVRHGWRRPPQHAGVPAGHQGEGHQRRRGQGRYRRVGPVRGRRAGGARHRGRGKEGRVDQRHGHGRRRPLRHVQHLRPRRSRRFPVPA
mmetsp:Transcript_94121/g.266243  ORF Transcript_94121/g.266243 Transcript_94121/m.266243 type:complete len:210 (+) Transcript_94121:254-883(+)